MIAWFAIAAFLLSGLCAAIRILVGPALADRVAALDVVLIALMGAIVVRAASTGDQTYLNLLIVIAIVSFVATTAASQFIERGGGRPS